MEKCNFYENIGYVEEFNQLMKIQGWLPIEEYFKTIKMCPGSLDWVLVLVIEKDGFQWLPIVAEYRTCEGCDNPEEKQGWYIYTSGKRIDDFANVLFFRELPIESQNYIDDYIDDIKKSQNKEIDRDIFIERICENAKNMQLNYHQKLMSKNKL